MILNNKHLFIDVKSGEAFCEICHGREKIPLPMSILSFEKWAEYFDKKHEKCESQPAKEG